MTTRRQVLKSGIVVGAAAAFTGPWLLSSPKAQAAIIDPSSIPKFVTPLYILPAMPPTLVLPDHTEYQVAERRIAAQMLPAGMPKTLVNGYGVPGMNSTFHSPGWTIENTVNRQTRVTWINQLVDSSGNFLPHLLTVDPTLHWANPPGGVSGRDSMPTFTSTPPPYTGPQPMVVHLHGTHDFEESDGLPETWWLPVAKNIPKGYATVGTDYDAFKQEAMERWGVNWAPGSSTSVYPNDQRATMLMYHDHVLGMTRLDIETGLVGPYIIAGGNTDFPPGTVPGPRPMPGDPPGKSYYDIAMILQDKSFNPDGSLNYPTNSALTGPYIPESPIPPYWTPNIQGTVSTVNGNTWPVLEVEPRRYRFRVLDMDTFRAYQLKIVSDPTARPGTIAVPTWVVGADGGIMPQAQPLHTTNTPIFMITTERVDIIVDFTGEAVGSEFYMINDLVTGDSSTPTNDVNNIGQIMQFKVVPLKSPDTTLPPDQLPGLPRRTLAPASETHKVSFNVLGNPNSTTEQSFFQLGSIDANGVNHLELWSDPISQTVTNGDTALWEVWNMPGVGSGHAFHIHLVEFQIQEREQLDANGQPTGTLIPLSPWELGEKDTAFAPVQSITRFIAPFDHVSRYIYHCHFVEHEDNEMMRPYRVQA